MEEKTHGLADAAGLTSADIARRELEAKEKAERAQTAASLGPANTKTGKAVSRAPPMNRTRPSLDEEVDCGLPPSTALPS